MIYPDVTENDRMVFQEELRERLPPKIFDAHIHIVRKESYLNGYMPKPEGYLKKFGNEHTFQRACEMFEKFLPGVNVSFNAFGSPTPSIDRDLAAESLGNDNRHYFGMRLLSPDDPVDRIEACVEKNRLVGFKPYPDLAAVTCGKKVNDVEVLDFYSDEQLEYINRKHLISTVHIPRKGRLADESNQRQIVELCEKCPGGIFIFAHIGRAYFMKNVVGMLDGLAKCPNAWLDTAMVNHSGVLRYAFDHFPQERMIFASDAPIAFLHGKSMEINNSYAYLMGEVCDIGNAICDTEGVVQFSPFYYEQLRAGLECGLSKNELEDFFFNNADRLFRSTAERLYCK